MSKNVFSLRTVCYGHKKWEKKLSTRWLLMDAKLAVYVGQTHMLYNNKKHITIFMGGSIKYYNIDT